jgi:hypothetical protein
MKHTTIPANGTYVKYMDAHELVTGIVCGATSQGVMVRRINTSFKYVIRLSELV